MIILPIIEIILANLIWGFGFVATIWTLDSLNWLQIFYYRFAISSAIGLLIYILFNRKNFKSYLKVTLIPSFFLLLEIFFQIVSLQFTTATEGGFLFVLYILFIPVIEYFLYRKSLSLRNCSYILLGLIGSLLMMKSTGIHVEKGAMLMIASAFFAGAHVVAIDKIDQSHFNSFFLNSFQLFWGMIFITPFFLLLGTHVHPILTSKATLGLISLTLGSTFIAYFLQIRAQIKISPVMISILFLLEALFSAFFAYIFLGERLNFLQWFGAFLVLLSAVLVSIDFFINSKKKID